MERRLRRALRRVRRALRRLRVATHTLWRAARAVLVSGWGVPRTPSTPPPILGRPAPTSIRAGGVSPRPLFIPFLFRVALWPGVRGLRLPLADPHPSPIRAPSASAASSDRGRFRRAAVVRRRALFAPSGAPGCSHGWERSAAQPVEGISVSRESPGGAGEGFMPPAILTSPRGDTWGHSNEAPAQAWAPFLYAHPPTRLGLPIRYV